MTKMHQQWTYGEREDLLPYLDGEDDEISSMRLKIEISQ